VTDSLTDPEDWALLAKYVAGDASSAERARVERWLAADPARRAIVDQLRFAALEAARAEPGSTDTDRAADDAAWRRLEGAMRPSPTLRLGQPLRRSRHGWLARLSVAAAIIAAVAIGYGLRAARGGLALREAWHEYATAAGERETVTLGDGTQFTLAPESRLRVPVDYVTGDRVVTLDGEAFFAVVHDPAHPFHVRAGNVAAIDVGTSFDVRAYGDEPGVRVGVAEGRVGLTVAAAAPGRGGPRQLTAGDLADVDSAGATAVTRGVDADAYLAWMKGTLVFRRTPLRVVMAELSRWYGVTFTSVDSGLDGMRLTATYERESLDHVLDQMGTVLGMRVERHGRRVTLSLSNHSP